MPTTAIAFTAPGSTRTRPTVARIPSSEAARRTSTIPSAIAEHRVDAIGQRRRAGVVGDACQVDPPAAVRPDLARDTDRAAGAGEPARRR